MTLIFTWILDGKEGGKSHEHTLHMSHFNILHDRVENVCKTSLNDTRALLRRIKPFLDIPSLTR